MCHVLLPPISDPSGDIQIVARSERVVLDVQGKHWRSDGHPVRDHGLIEMPIGVAMDLVDEMIEAITLAHNQTSTAVGVWSQETTRRMGTAFGKGRRHIHQRHLKVQRIAASAF